MELYQLKTFVKVAEEGNLTRAAQRLFTSQPAISAQIKALEEELGVTLFDRSSRGMRLTAKGKILYHQAAETLAAAAALAADAKRLQHEVLGELRIGVHTDFEFMRIGELLRRLKTTHPGIDPYFSQSMSAQILPDLREGMLDAGFFFGPCNAADLATRRLAEVPMRVVAPAAWADRVVDAPAAALAALPWIYTSDTCPFYALSEELFERFGSRPDQVAYVDSEDAVRALLRSGAGLSLLRADDAARLASHGEVCIWNGPTPSIALGLAVQRQRAAEPVINALLDVCAALWEEPREAAGGRIGA
jgi:DNA-binding transcriptional LysR family regulator